LGSYPRAIVVEDFDGDGVLDVASTYFIPLRETAGFSVLFGEGDGSLGARKDYETGWRGGADLTSGDFDGDGFPDLAVANSGRVFTVLLNDGQGNFTVSAEMSIVDNTHSVAAGDFNGDGRLDLVGTGSAP
jgi:hypothetical protein